jgi:hypothetical protein
MASCAECHAPVPIHRKLYCSETCGQRARRKRNPEKARERTRKWRDRNPEHGRAGNRERSRRWREENPERNRETKRRWHQQHRERIRERNRAHWTRLTPIGEAICRTFAILPDAARAEYAGWVMFIALSDHRYMRVVGQWEVDDWLARYDAEIGDYLAGR